MLRWVWLLGCVVQLGAGQTLTLEQALDNARTMHPQMKIAHAQAQVMQARTVQTRAGMLPTVGLVGSYSRQTANFVLQPGQLPQSVTTNANTTAQFVNSKFSDKSYNYWRFALSANLLLFDFGQTPKRWMASESTYDAQDGNQRVTSLQVALNTRTAFFNARAMKDLVRVAQSTLENQGRHLEQIQGFVDVGTRDMIDLAQAKTDYSNAKVSVITAQNNYDSAKASLNLAMGVEGGTDYDVADDVMDPVEDETKDTDALMALALAARPEFQVFRAQKRAQELTLESVRANYWPNLNGTAQLTDAGSDITKPGVNWAVGLVMNWPLFAGGLQVGQAEEAGATLAAISAQADMVRQNIRLEVEQARLGVRAAKGMVESAKEALANAQEQLRLAEGRYSTGVGGVIELGDAQVAATSASAQLVQAQQTLASARATLLKALGRGA